MSAELRVICDTTPSDGVVRMLEDLLERARKGELRSIVAAYETKGNHGHAMAWGADANPMAIVGELHLAQFSVLVEAGRVKPP